jgi:hypothetical protein
MKIYLSNYRNHWTSPYKILEKVFFWREIDYDEPIIKKLKNILEPFSTAWMKFLDFIHPRIKYVKIDYWDVWNMDHTSLKRMEHGPNHTYVCDYEGIRKVYERIDNGLRLFGKYYRNLWD